MAMPEDDVFTPNATRSRPPFGGAQARGKIIDQDGRELPDGPQHPGFESFQIGRAHV